MKKILARELVNQYQPAELIGMQLFTRQYGAWPGGVVTIVQVSPDPAAPEIVFQVKSDAHGEIGVFDHEEVMVFPSPDRPSAVADLSIERASREEDNTKVSVVDMLKLALSEVIEGNKNVKIGFVCLVDEADDDEMQLATYRCGMNKLEEMGLMETCKLEAWERWKHGDGT